MNNCNIQKFDKEGNFLLRWGSEGSNDGELKRLAGIDVDSFGNIYVVDVGSDRIKKFDSNGEFITIFSSNLLICALFPLLVSLTISRLSLE